MIKHFVQVPNEIFRTFAKKPLHTRKVQSTIIPHAYFYLSGHTGLSTEMQNKKNTTFFKTFFYTGIDKKNDLKYILKSLVREGGR